MRLKSLASFAAAIASILFVSTQSVYAAAPDIPAPAVAEPRIDVVVTDAPARPFFEGLADGTRYNIILEPGVAGTITLKLHNVTVPEVLDAVRETYGYDYRRMATGYVITAPAMQTRIFQINYLDLERRGTSRTRVESGQVSQGTGAQGGASGGGGSQSSGGSAKTELSEPPGGVFGPNSSAQNAKVAEITGSSVSTRSASDFWHDLETSLHGLVPGEGGRDIVINSSSGVVAVHATVRELRDVEQFLRRIQQVATREVILEARVIEVQLSDGFQAGINWALLGKTGNRTISGFQTGPQQGFGSSDLLTQPSHAVSLSPGGTPITSAVTNALGGAFALAVNAADFSAYIELLGTQGKARVLSSPRVSTLNNQKAVIKAGSEEYFVTGVSSNTVVGTASATSSNVELAPFFSGVALDVTPQISESGEVILHIHPTVSDVTEKVKLFTVSGVANSLPLAFSTTREADSIVRAKSGQLIVIGGLMQTTTTAQNYRLPLLGDLPFVGNLFKSQQKSEHHSELVILLRPVVIEDDGEWQRVGDQLVGDAVALDPTAGSGH